MRVLVVEDNDDLAGILQSRLNHAGLVTQRVRTAGEAEVAAAETAYRAIVLDLGLPDHDGLVFLQKLRTKGAATPVIVVSARDGLNDRLNGLRAGADDYLPKPFSVEELVARLLALSRRPQRFIGRTLRFGNVAIDLESREICIGSENCACQPREVLVLELLMRNPGEVVRRTFIYDQLFGVEANESPDTVDVYIHRLRRQLADSGSTAHIHTIRGVGYMLSDVPPPGSRTAAMRHSPAQ